MIERGHEPAVPKSAGAQSVRLNQPQASVSAAATVAAEDLRHSGPWWRGNAAAAIGDEVTEGMGNADAQADPPLTVRTDALGRLQLSGELDMASAPTLSRALQPSVARGGVVELDASQVTFMDSTGVHALLDAARQLGERGHLVLVRPSAAVQRVIEVCGLDGIIDISHDGHV